MEIKPEDELSNIVLFPVKEDDPRNQVNFLYEPSERPYCHHASVRVDEKERQVRCKICGAVVEPFDWMLSVAKRETRLADDVRHLRQEERERRKKARERRKRKRYFLTQKLYGVAMLILTAVSVKLLEGDITVAFILVPMGIVLITSKEMLIVNEYFWESEGV